jgi:hypothetical protein
LYFLDAADNLMAININTSGNTVRMGTPHALFHAGGIQTQQGPYAVTADGKKFLIHSGDAKEESAPDSGAKLASQTKELTLPMNYRLS